MIADNGPDLPTHRAFSLVQREGKDDHWIALGLVYPHRDKEGFSILLDAFPLDGRITCRTINVEEAQQEGKRPSG